MSEFIVNRNKSRQKENVNWLKIKRLCYTKASPGIIYYEYDYDEEFKEIIVNESGRKLRREHSRVMPELVPKLFKEAVPITNAKFAYLQSLCALLAIRSDYHPFYSWRQL